MIKPRIVPDGERRFFIQMPAFDFHRKFGDFQSIPAALKFLSIYMGTTTDEFLRKLRPATAAEFAREK